MAFPGTPREAEVWPAARRAPPVPPLDKRFLKKWWICAEIKMVEIFKGEVQSICRSRCLFPQKGGKWWMFCFFENAEVYLWKEISSKVKVSET